MLITAVNEFTLLDYPGKIAAIIFTAGCNMRCGYCHNSQFVIPEELEKMKGNFIPFEAVKNFLKTRVDKLDGVVISGGEPTIHNHLPEFMEKIKDMGFLVKLDTNGTNSKMIKKILDKNLADYIAMDIKTSLNKYNDLTRMNINIKEITKSIELIKNSNIKYEFRSTILPECHDLETLKEMGQMIKDSRLWALQNFRNISVLNEKFKEFSSFSKKELEEFKIELEDYVNKIEIRH